MPNIGTKIYFVFHFALIPGVTHIPLVFCPTELHCKRMQPQLAAATSKPGIPSTFCPTLSYTFNLLLAAQGRCDAKPLCPHKLQLYYTKLNINKLFIIHFLQVLCQQTVPKLYLISVVDVVSESVHQRGVLSFATAGHLLMAPSHLHCKTKDVAPK